MSATQGSLSERGPPAKPIVVLHVIMALHRGGAELMLCRLLRHQCTEPSIRHEVICLGSPAGSAGPVADAIARLGVSVEVLHINRTRDVLPGFLRLVKYISARKPDVVQSWMYHSDLIGGLAARVAGCRRVFWGVRISDIGPHTGIPTRTRLIRRLCALSSRLLPTKIVYVAHSARSSHEAAGYDARKGVVIPNGYDLNISADRGRLRRELHLAPHDLLIGSVARVDVQKGHEVFIEAAALLGRREPKALFLLIGRYATAANATLMDQVVRTGMADRFFLLGERDDVHDCLASLDIFCMHSRSEGFPNALAEAMCNAVPVVATQVGDATWLVGDTGNLVPPGDAEALSAALATLTAKSSAERARMGQLGRARVAENFSIQTVGAQYLELYCS